MVHENNKIREAVLYHSQYITSFKYLIGFYILQHTQNDVVKWIGKKIHLKNKISRELNVIREYK